jgi:hypothetical protein
LLVSCTPHLDVFVPNHLGSQRCPSYHCVRLGVGSACSIRVVCHVPLVSLSVSLGFDALAPLPPRSLGQEITHRWWCHRCHGGLHGGPLPTGPSLNRARCWVRQMPADAHHQLRGGDVLNLHQLVVQPIHPIGGGWW